MSALSEAPGIRLRAADLLALRDAPAGPVRARPATRKPGAVAARAPGAGMDLREIRAFAEGDDARRIDAAATARTGTPHVRSFHEERDDGLLLVADFRPAMLWGTGESLRSVRAARALARAGWQAALRGASVGAVAVAAGGVASLSPRTGVAQMGAVARMLAAEHDAALDGAPGEPRPAFGASGAGRSLAEALVRAARLAPAGAEVLIASAADGLAPDDEPALARLARRRRVGLLLALDPVETAPPDRPLPIRAGGAIRFARLAPFDRQGLAARLGRLNVALVTVDP